ncbi:membrane protein [Photobacterium aquae]|uniref:Membrane protein n=1 Tax=Photobacterium aquae TaxID=1195763 RepID=A0A0J1HDF7_9GAMM|nr:outer membrane lipoprotein-sorting protein [Photobacterium aquae]KLV09666.1 membrane protein [Photobacterium aquae]
MADMAGKATTASTETQDAGQMLARADHYRSDGGDIKVVSEVSLYEEGSLDKRRRYHVYTRAKRESLVVFKSDVEAGQKMLMLGDNYWLLMPKSRRPIRITPMQKLLGEASVGDISTLTWSQDYAGQWRGSETIEAIDGKPVLANKLVLEATLGGASYHRIELWLEAGSDFPLKANLYLRSGKMAKVAYYHRGIRDGSPAVVAMTLLDQIQPERKTVIEYVAFAPSALADKYFNPAYLSRNGVSEL